MGTLLFAHLHFIASRSVMVCLLLCKRVRTTIIPGIMSVWSAVHDELSHVMGRTLVKSKYLMKLTSYYMALILISCRVFLSLTFCLEITSTWRNLKVTQLGVVLVIQRGCLATRELSSWKTSRGRRSGEAWDSLIGTRLESIIRWKVYCERL